jgi:hypothetical protein
MGAVEYSRDPEAQVEYTRGAETHFALFRRFVNPDDPPRFALLPKEIALLASLDDQGLGHRLARNETAHRLIDAFFELASREEIEPPTYMMLRSFVAAVGMHAESISLAELGLEVAGMPGSSVRSN